MAEAAPPPLQPLHNYTTYELVGAGPEATPVIYQNETANIIVSAMQVPGEYSLLLFYFCWVDTFLLQEILYCLYYTVYIMGLVSTSYLCIGFRNYLEFGSKFSKKFFFFHLTGSEMYF